MEKAMNDIDQIITDLQHQIFTQTGEQFSKALIDHLVNPRNLCSMENPDGCARITGPCGDTMEIFIQVQDDRITKASFTTDGCMTTIVSGSMAVHLATNREIIDALDISQKLILEHLGGLPQGSEHCALLAADTLHAAIEDYITSKNHPWKRMYQRR